MGYRWMKILGTVIGLIGVIIGIARLIPVFMVIPTWIWHSQQQYVFSGYLVILIIIAWGIALIGVILGWWTKRAGGIYVLVAAGIVLIVLIYCIFTGHESPDRTIYTFLLPIELIFYIIGGILMVIAKVKTPKY